MYVFILFIIILIIILLLLFIKKNSLYFIKNIESFTIVDEELIREEENNKNALCSNFYKNAFCQFDINSNKNMCKYQKDNVKIAFDAPDFCCNGGCKNISSSHKSSSKESSSMFLNKNNIKENSTENQIDNNLISTETNYYCNIGGNCNKFNGTILNSHISTNNCGTDVLNNQLLLPYASYQDCSSSLNPCDKYNNPEWSYAKIKTECLKDVNCGICKNNDGKGKCVEGTATQPLDLEKYYTCGPDKYEYGNHTEYII
jgi:hypothetical protein